jgi:eukaryotic-like serine/threonine-protein kinase
MSTWNPRANDLFLKAVELRSREERQALIAQECGADESLRAEVERLLEASDRAGSFLVKPAAEVGLTTVAPSLGDETAAVVELGMAGSVIGPYKLLQQIGEGGMGTVYMAEQTRPVRRKVALKVIKPGTDSQQVIARFEAERQALAMMDHVNIARVLDAGATESGRPYFVMELVHGVPITNYCDDNHLTPRQRMELFVPVCRAIQHAHQKGIIHRDIKPSNVMITLYDGKPVPKVIDFGVAKATEQKLTERTLFTQYGTLVGTLEYMSPEQAEMSALGVDTRSDIYSLGVLLYELLTGSTPLSRKRLKQAAFTEILRLIREEEPPRPSTRLSESGEALASISAQRHMEPARLTKLVRGELDWIVMKTLEKDRNRRYETASGFAADVQRYLNDEPVQACPPSAQYRFRKFARRNKRALGTMATLALAALVTMVALAVSNVRIKKETAEKVEALTEKTVALAAAQASERNVKIQEGLAKENAVRADTERGVAVAHEKTAKKAELTARQRYYAAQMNLAMQASEAGDPARTLELLETQRPRFDRDDLRGFEWYHLWRVCHRGLRARLPHPAANVTGVVFLPDGKTLASIGGGSIKLWDVAAAQKKIEWPTNNGWGIMVSPDGKRLGTWGQHDPSRVWDTSNGRQLAVFEGTTAPTFSPDGKLIAVARGTDIEFWDLATGKRHSVLHRSKAEGIDNMTGQGSFVFAPDARTAIARVSEVRLRIYRWDGANWQEGEEIPQQNWYLPTAFSPDGKMIAIGGINLRLFSAETGRELGAPVGHTGIVYSVAFSPDGKSLASAGGDRTARVWDLATNKQKNSFPHPGPVYSVAYSSDGKTLASAGTHGTLRLWDIGAEEAPAMLDAWAGAVAFLPDGKTLVAAAGAGTTLRDVETGIEMARLENMGPLLTLSHDGNRLAVTNGHEANLWDLRTRKRYAVLKGHERYIYSLTISPDDTTLATASYDGTVRLWDLATQETRLTIKPGMPMSAVAFSPDGRTLATGGLFENIQLWDVATGRSLLTLQDHDGQNAGSWCWSVAFSPDGKTLAGASQSGVVRIWDTTTVRLLASLKGHTDNVQCLIFSPDGGTLATAGVDRTVRLWDAATGQEKITFKANTGAVNGLAFSRDGGMLAAASLSGPIRLWRTSREPQATALKTEFDPDDPDAVATVTDPGSQLRTAVRLSQAAEAVTSCRNAIELNPKSATAHCKLGNALKTQGKVDEAIACYRRAIELDPKDVDGHNHLGLALEGQGKLDQAIACYRRAIELDPKSSWTRDRLSYALVSFAWNLANVRDPKFRDTGRAIEAIKEAVELAPQAVRTWQLLGWVQYRAGNWKASIDALEKSCKLQNPGDRGQWVVLSLAHRMLATAMDLPQSERDRHRAEARRYYDQAAHQIDGAVARGEYVSQDTQALRVEAAEALGIELKPK